MLSFTLSLISLLLIFVMKSFIGSFFAIVAIIIAFVQIKKKKLLNYIGLILSIVLLVYSIFAFVIASKSVSSVIDKSKRNTYMHIEESLAEGALITVKEYNHECAESGNACVLPPILKKDLDYADNYDDFKSTLKDCDGYIDIKYGNAKVYLKCPDYKTDGYSEK